MTHPSLRTMTAPIAPVGATGAVLLAAPVEGGAA